MANTKAWISAFRLRTLPLAVSSIALGCFLAAFDGKFNGWVCTLAIATTVFLQILSNLANDYGDAMKGADDEGRIGPARAVSSGAISPKAMRMGIGIFVVLSLLSGCSLIWIGTEGLDRTYVIGFFVLGVAAIGAAIKYTVGKGAYGYMGLGDLFVFLFFGLTGVLGTYFLHTHTFRPELLLPASTLGLLSAGVLNLNNMRDRENDAKTGKRTLVVFLGGQRAKLYHLFLIGAAFGCGVLFTLLRFESPWQWIFLVTLPLLIINVRTVLINQQPRDLDPHLKKLALTTLLFALTFGLGLII